MKTPDSTKLIFRGPPRLIEGVAPVPFKDAVSADLPTLEVKLPPVDAEPEHLTMQVMPAGESATRLRCSFPESTAPGSYEGTVRIGAEQQYAVAIDVEAYPSLLISPRSLSVRGAPGTEAVVNLTAVNNGNIVCELPRVHRLGLLDVKGTGRAMGVALGVALDNKVKNGMGRVDLFTEEMARSHTGRVDLIVEEGSGPLAPGELRQLRIIVRIPAGIKKGRIYAGTWMVLKAGYHVEIQVPNGVTQKESDYEHDNLRTSAE